MACYSGHPAPHLRARLRRFEIASGDFVAPNARHRRLVVPAPVPESAHEDAEVTGARTRAAMTWAQRLRRAFAIDISRCPRCGAPLRVLAAITDRVIAAILVHLESRAARFLRPTWH